MIYFFNEASDFLLQNYLFIPSSQQFLDQDPSRKWILTDDRARLEFFIFSISNGDIKSVITFQVIVFFLDTSRLQFTIFELNADFKYLLSRMKLENILYVYFIKIL